METFSSHESNSERASTDSLLVATLLDQVLDGEAPNGTVSEVLGGLKREIEDLGRQLRGLEPAEDQDPQTMLDQHLDAAAALERLLQKGVLRADMTIGEAAATLDQL